MSDDPEIQRAVRRTVGIAALRRLRRIVDAENALEAEKARWGQRLTIFFVVLAACVLLAVAWIVIR
jgi:type VI protein secretion system component VasF